MRHAALRREVVATCRRMNALGINRGTSGNVSARVPGGFLVTPSGFPYDAMRPQDVVEMTIDGRATGRLPPSTEWPFHAAVYAGRPDARAIVHAHSEAAMALACLRREVPAFHYMVAAAGGTSLRCADYATFGTEALARHVLAALAGRTACLLANHGQVALAPTLKRALALAVEVESLCSTYLRALAVGEPVTLTAAEMAEVLAKFATYGAPRAAAPASRSAGRLPPAGRPPRQR